MSNKHEAGSKARVGFVGVGAMGGPMAANPMRAGYHAAIPKRAQAKARKLLALGAQLAPSPREVAASDGVITMVPDTAAVEQVLFGDDGVAGGLKRGSLLIDMSTISPTATVDFGQRLHALGCEMWDAPVSGGPKGAVEGSLGIMVGGAREVFNRSLPLLRSMGKAITYTGPLGNGQKTKLVNQLVGATNLLGAVEGLRLARKAGLDVPTTVQALFEWRRQFLDGHEPSAVDPERGLRAGFQHPAAAQRPEPHQRLDWQFGRLLPRRTSGVFALFQRHGDGLGESG